MIKARDIKKIESIIEFSAGEQQTALGEKDEKA